MKTAAILFASTIAASCPALAQEAPPTDPDAATAAARARDHVHQEANEDIIVTAPFVRDLNILAGTSVISGTELVREMRPQLGDTLARLPGVSATSFSPGASRPVLRGFQGERVRVLVDGIGSIDVSNTSADHAVTIDPITAHRIEVLHGPAALLFGSQAIGGAVNVFDRRIPRRTAEPAEDVHVDAVFAYGSAANERSAGAGVDLPFDEGGLVFHFDGSYRNTDDVRIGGFVLSPAARAEQLAIADEEAAEGHAEEAAEARAFAALRGRLPNTATRTETAGVGLALLRESGNLGFSISYYGSRYGVPARPGGGHHHEEEAGGTGGHAGEVDVSIDLEQIRGDLRGEVKVGGGLVDRIRVRAGFADYRHTEFEGEEVGTIFRTEGMEGRLELVQADRGGWRGATGAQFFTRKLTAIGEEAFVPPNSSEQIALFTLQELERGPLELEAAARYERTRVGATTIGFARSFDALSFAAGGSYELARRIRAGLNLSRAERAPSPEELLSNGPHIATQSFERGDPGLDTESSLGAELYVRADRPGYDLTASLFYSRFSNYIFQSATGEVEDELPVFQYLQRDATYWGFELGASATLARAGGFRIVADTVADYVRATIADGGGPVPRIPPMRVLGGIEAQSARLDGRLEVEKTFAQNRGAALEGPTRGFTLVNASLAWRPWGRSNPSSIILSASNIFDVDARRHASFTRDFAPLAGRDLRVSARVSF
ncbi:MAG TPA: TonB-dependent receptor [Allosphingosinicella sp.]|nr:TonB-dependent receptor [Allosphingosinicella sp.]